MSEQKPFRLYLDTSVFGGCFDDGFAEDSKRVIEYIRSGLMHLVYSETLEGELKRAPEKVREVFELLPQAACFRIDSPKEIATLAQAYLDANVVSKKWRDDCLHVATATIARADAIISWNFKHIRSLA